MVKRSVLSAADQLILILVSDSIVCAEKPGHRYVTEAAGFGVLKERAVEVLRAAEIAWLVGVAFHLVGRGMNDVFRC